MGVVGGNEDGPLSVLAANSSAIFAVGAVFVASFSAVPAAPEAEPRVDRAIVVLGKLLVWPA